MDGSAFFFFTGVAFLGGATFLTGVLFFTGVGFATFLGEVLGVGAFLDDFGTGTHWFLQTITRSLYFRSDRYNLW